MKKTTITLALVLVFLFTSNIFAQNFKLSPDHPKYDQVVLNLLEGLSSDNEGLKFSSAYALGEIKSEAAVNKLTSMLRNHKDENFRIMAALSLTKIGTDRSLFLVKRVGKFTDSKKLASFCEKFYLAKTYSLPAADQVVVASLFK